jgi:hypothetical protein
MAAIPKVGAERIKEVHLLANPPSFIERNVGFVGASIFSIAYYVAPIYLLLAPIVLLRAPFSRSTWLFLLPILVSAITPSGYSRIVLTSYLMRCVPRYFNYSEVLFTKLRSGGDLETVWWLIRSARSLTTR